MPDTAALTDLDTNSFFSASLAQRDSDVFAAIAKEQTRQQQQIELIASENIARSEERRVGKECRRLCRTRWSP